MLIDPEQIKELDEYIFQLGTSLASIKTIAKIQERALKQGLLTTDEEPRAMDVIYNLKRVIESLAWLADSSLKRTPFDAEQVANRLRERLQQTAFDLLDQGTKP